MSNEFNPDLIPGNHSNVRRINRNVILNIIRERQPISRVVISGIIGLTKSTISNIVNELIAEGLVQEMSVAESTGGRKPTLLKMASAGIISGAICIHREKTLLGLSNLDGNILQKQIIDTRRENAEDFIEKCGQELKAMLESLSYTRFLGLGVSVPGLVRNRDGLILLVPRLGWRNVAAKLILDKMFDVPVFVDNEANVEALAHLFYGRENEQHGNFVQISVGHGLGVGIVLNGNLLRGTSTSSIEFGHTVINEEGILCSCGNRGCLEAYTSETATIEKYHQLLTKSGQPAPASTLQIDNVTARTVENGIELSWNGDSQAVKYAIHRGTTPGYKATPKNNIAVISAPPFVDVAIKESQKYYYRVRPMDAFNRGEILSDSVACEAPKVSVAFRDTFAGSELDYYAISGSNRLKALPGKLRFGDPGLRGQDTVIHRNGSYRNYIASGIVQPTKIGIWDSIGLLVKAQSGNEWYSATIAYGTHLKERYNLALMRRRMVNGEREELWLAFYPLQIDPNSDYQIKVGVFGDWIRVKAWKNGTVEPHGWFLTYKDTQQWRDGTVGIRHFGDVAEVKEVSLIPLIAEIERTELGDVYVDPIKESDIYFRNLLMAAKKGNESAIEALKHTGKYLGKGIANIHNGLGINTIFISGRIVEAWKIIEEAIKDEFSKNSFGENLAALKIVALENTDDYELLGCGALVNRTLFEGLRIVDTNY